MPMSASERRRLMKAGMPESISRDTTIFIKKALMSAIDKEVNIRWPSADDDDRKVLKTQRDRIAKFLGV